MLEGDCCGLGKEKNGKILAVPNKAKSLVWPCQVQLELGWQREKRKGMLL